MRPILLALALCLSGATNSGCTALGPVGQSKADAVKADIARIEAEVGPQIPGIETLVAQIGASDYIGAAATLVTVAPAIYAAGGPAVADAKALVADLRALLSAAAAGKSVQPMLDLARAEAILSGPATKGSAKAVPGPADANAPGVVTWEADGATWQRTQFPHAVLVERIR